MYLLEVYVSNASLSINKTFSYSSINYVEPFCRVEVYFNKHLTTGFVISCNEEEIIDAPYKILNINKVIDEEPIINKAQFELAKWLSYTTISPFIACLNTLLPKVLKTNGKKLNPKTIKKIKINNIEYSFSKKQKEVFLKLYDDMPLSEAKKISSSIIEKFILHNVITVLEKQRQYNDSGIFIKDNFKALTAQQEAVYNQFLNSDKMVSLLFGVTGSGKTEVYLHLAKEYLKQNKEILILVPEIALTPQMISRVEERFNDVIFYHSNLNDQERYEQYMRLKDGNVKIVVGTRSAIFLPFNNLGLIIIDEEHDSSYKQDSVPTYQIKNVAIKRAKDFKAKILLASATPSLDSYSHALKGDYEFLKLPNRINKQLPEIKLVNLTKEIKNNSSYIVSNKLKEEIALRLNNHEQTIILLNRRGYSPIIKCSECTATLTCQYCELPLNYHSDDSLLHCHTCGRVFSNIDECTQCHSHKLIRYGFGTMRVEEELKKMFPQARIVRMDKDTVGKKNAHKKIFEAMENKTIDILIGTQMIAKGLDFPSVTLVGILNADAGLAHQDYNAAKLTFDLLMQASGRSGRANNKGLVIIQAFNPDHYVLRAVMQQNYDYFFNIEMNYRAKTSYPPYSHLLALELIDKNDIRMQSSLKYLIEQLSNIGIKVYRPVMLNKINGFIRYRILLSNKELLPLIQELWKIVDSYYLKRTFSSLKVDIDPLYLE